MSRTSVLLIPMENEEWYNRERPHQALDYRTPEVAYWEMRLPLKKLE